MDQLSAQNGRTQKDRRSSRFFPSFFIDLFVKQAPPTMDQALLSEAQKVVVGHLKAVNKLDRVGDGDNSYLKCCITGHPNADLVPIIPAKPSSSYLQTFCYSLGIFTRYPPYGNVKQVQQAYLSRMTRWNQMPLDSFLGILMDKGDFLIFPTLRCLVRIVYLLELWFKKKEDDPASSFGMVDIYDMLPDPNWRCASIQPKSAGGNQDSIFEACDGDITVDVFEYKACAFKSLRLKRSSIDIHGNAEEVLHVADRREINTSSGVLKTSLPLDFKPELPPLRLAAHPAIIFLKNDACLRQRLELLDEDEIYYCPELDQVRRVGEYVMDLLSSDHLSRFRSLDNRPTDILGFALPPI
jgi:hypothetical protein